MRLCFALPEKEYLLKYHRIEYGYGSSLQAIILPDAADAIRVNAEYRDDVLAVHLPKVPATQPNGIEIKLR